MKKRKQVIVTGAHHLDVTGWLSGIEENISGLQPLANSMATALQQVGIKPPSELADLADAFQQNIVAPVSGSISNQSVGTTIVDFFRQQMTAKANGQKLPPHLNTVANGGNSVLGVLGIQQFFSNPLVVVAFVIIIGTIVYLIAKR
jgi:hypothetical protein